MMPSHPYRSLNRSINEIRLLQLHNADDAGADIVCNLIHVSLDDTIQYDALSYTWGSKIDPQEIIVDGHRFEVTKNLSAALRVIRNEHKRNYLWIDAICIDQEDVQERNKEVLRMFQIYQRARQVLVWLGPATDDSNLALNHLLTLSASAAISHRPFVRAMRNLTYLFTLFLLWCSFVIFSPANFCMVIALYRLGHHNTGFYRIGYSVTLGFLGLHVFRGSMSAVFLWRKHFWRHREFEAPGTDLPDAEIIAALAAFFQREWFSRTWVLQECAAAKDILMLCGTQSLHWDDIMDAADMMHHIARSDQSRSPYVDVPYLRFQNFDKVRDTEYLSREWSNVQCSLLYLMEEFSSHEASDFRDKVYGLLSFSSEGRSRMSFSGLNATRLLPDYEKTVEQVYADTAKFIIESSGWLDVLQACLHKGSVCNLPSWVPDWTVKLVRPRGEPDYWHTPFYVEDDAMFPRRPVAVFLSGSRRLVVHGIAIARLQKCERKFKRQPFNDIYASIRDGTGLMPEKLGSSYSDLITLVTAVVFSYAKVMMVLNNIFLSLGGHIVYSYLARKNLFGTGYIFKNTIMARARHKPKRRNRLGSSFARTFEASLDVLTDKRHPDYGPTYWAGEVLCDGFKYALSYGGKLAVLTWARDAEAGDLLVMFLGAKVPFIVKPVKTPSATSNPNRRNRNEYRLLGPATASMMDGYLHLEARKAFQQGKLPVERFTLI